MPRCTGRTSARLSAGCGIRAIEISSSWRRHLKFRCRSLSLALSESRRAVRVRREPEQVQALLKVAGRNRALLATAIMAGGLRVSELTHLQWRNLDLKAGVLRVPVSKTAAGLREIAP